MSLVFNPNLEVEVEVGGLRVKVSFSYIDNSMPAWVKKSCLKMEEREKSKERHKIPFYLRKMTKIKKTERDWRDGSAVG